MKPDSSIEDQGLHDNAMYAEEDEWYMGYGIYDYSLKRNITYGYIICIKRYIKSYDYSNHMQAHMFI